MNQRKHRACLTCIRAKAKCSPSDERPDVCHRCHRLNKQCTYAEVTKRPGPGPKSRSRVRQLEQRVESLMDLIIANNGTSKPTAVNASIISPEKDTPVHLTTPGSSIPADSINTPEEDLDCYAPRPFEVYDVIESGVIEEQYAYVLLNEFKTSFIAKFPFVVVDLDGPTMRRQQPFLFHAILTVSAYERIPVQHLLEQELRRQIARIIEHSWKNLEILQGLLVYAAWYHSFFHPTNQQLAIIVQICVALVQDLGYSKNQKDKIRPVSLAQCGKAPDFDLLGSKRAFLGTFFLTVAFAQAWRKRGSLPYTRFMGQCCELFEESSVPTDALIAPLVKATELFSRVSDHFSYDDIDNADLKGDLILEASTTSFRKELNDLRRSSFKLPAVKENITVNLTFCHLDIWIHECCIHTLLWPSQPDLQTPSLTRLKMLHHTMDATTSYLKSLLRLSPKPLHQLAFQSWTGWFYSIIIICKLIFLEENERLGNTQFHPMPQEVDELIPENQEHQDEANSIRGAHRSTEQPGWSPLAVTREYDVQNIFNRFMDLLSFTLPPGSRPWALGKDKRGSLYAIACIQHTIIQGFSKRIQQTERSADTDGRVSASPHRPVDNNGGGTSTSEYNASARSRTVFSTSNDQLTHATVQSSLPFVNGLSFDTLNFDGIAIPPSYALQSTGLDDWIWDTVMDDFVMPSL